MAHDLSHKGVRFSMQKFMILMTKKFGFLNQITCLV